MAGENLEPHQGNRVFVPNPRSTSTKFGVFIGWGGGAGQFGASWRRGTEPVSRALDAGANRLIGPHWLRRHWARRGRMQGICCVGWARRIPASDGLRDLSR